MDGASRPTITTARAGENPCTSRKATTSAATASRTSAAIGPPRSNRGPAGSPLTISCTVMPLPAPSRGKRLGLRLPKLPELHERARRFRVVRDLRQERRDAPTQLVRLLLVTERRDIHHDVLRGAVGGGLGQPGCDREVARGVPFRSCRTLPGQGQASSVRSGTSAAITAAARIAADRVAVSASVPRGSLIAAANAP